MDAHAGQFRRDGKTPYFEHPKRVVQLVEGDLELQAVAWLHDVLEDTEWTSADLFKYGVTFSVVQSVELLTRGKDVSYSDYLTWLKGNYSATRVKIADMVANLTDNPSEKQVVKYTRALQFLSS